MVYSSESEVVIFREYGYDETVGHHYQLYSNSFATPGRQLLSGVMQNDALQMANQNVLDFDLSSSGQVAVFLSTATNLSHSETPFIKLFHRNISLGSDLALLTSNSGNELDRDVVEFEAPKNTSDIYYISAATNILDSELSVSRRLYKFNVGTKTSTLIMDDANQIKILDSSDDGQFLLLLSDRVLVDRAAATDKLYLYNTQNAEITYLEVRQPNVQSPSRPLYDSIEYAYLSGDGSLVVYGGTSNNEEIGIYNVSSKTTQDLSFFVNRYQHFYGVAGVAYNGDKLLLRTRNEATWTTFLTEYSLSNHSQKVVSVDVANTPVHVGSVSNYGANGSFAYSNTSTYNTSAYIIYQSDATDIGDELPSAPSLEATSSVGKIDLTWSGDGATTYVLAHHKAGQRHSYQKLTDTITTSYTMNLSGSDSSFDHIFELHACNKFYQCRSAGAAAKFIMPEKVVTGLAVSDSEYFGYQDLSWNPIEGVELYRVKIRYGNSASTRTARATGYTIDTSYGNYDNIAVSVAACSAYNACGVYSEELLVTRGPTQIDNLRVFVDEELKVPTFTWTADSKSDGVRIYRRLPQESSYTLLGYVKESSYTDSSATLGSASISYKIEVCQSGGEICGDEYRFYVSQPDSDGIVPSLSITSNATEVILRAYTNYSFETVQFYRVENIFEQKLLDTYDSGINVSSYSFTDTTAEPEKEYSYFVRACLNNICKDSQPQKFTGLEIYDSEIGSFKNLTASQTGFRDKVQLSWESSGTIDSIDVYRNGGHVVTLSGDATSYSDYSVSPGRNYEYYLIPKIRRNGRSLVLGSRSETVTGFVSYDGEHFDIPEAPVVSTGYQRHYDRVSVNWPDIANTEYYEVYTSTEENGVFSLQRVSYSSYLYMYNLRPGISFYVYVKACTRFACSDASDTLLVGTFDSVEVPSDNATKPELTLTNENGILVSVAAVENANFFTLYVYDRPYDTSPWSSTFDGLNHTYTSVSKGRRYYFRTQACNPAGCSGMSEMAEIYVPSDDEASNESRRLYHLYSVSTYTKNQVRIRYENDSYSGNIKPVLKLYSSVSRDGEKTLVKQVANPSNWGGNLYVSNLTPGQLYYFWLESCYGTDCSISEQYMGHRIADYSAIEIPTPRAPTVSYQSHLGSIRYSYDNVPHSAELKVFHKTSEGLTELSSLRADYQTRSLNIDTEDSYYFASDELFYAQFCIDDRCGLMSPGAIGRAAARTTNRIDMTHGDLWSGYSGHSSVKNRMSLYYTLEPRQYLAVEKGFSLSFNMNLSVSTQCNLKRLDLRADSESYSNWQDSEQMNLLSVQTSGGDCEDSQFDVSEVHFILGGDNNNVFSVAKDTVYGNNILVELVADEHFNTQIKVNGTLLGSATMTRLRNLFPNLMKLQFVGDYRRPGSDFVADFVATSTGSLARTRGLPTTRVYVTSEINGDVSVFWRTFDQEGTSVEFRVYTLDSDDYLDMVSMVSQPYRSLDNDTNQIAIDNDGTYVVGVSVCTAAGCSGQDFTTFSASTQFLPPEFTLTTTRSAGEVQINWTGVELASKYEVYGGTSSQTFGKLMTLAETELLLQNIQVSPYYIAMKSCTDRICSALSSIHIVTVPLDSDGDGLTDDREAELGTNPNLVDTDGDGLSDYEEHHLGTSPTNPDTDGDGISDGDEIASGENPLSTVACNSAGCRLKNRAWFKYLLINQ